MITLLFALAYATAWLLTSARYLANRMDNPVHADADDLADALLAGWIWPLYWAWHFYVIAVTDLALRSRRK